MTHDATRGETPTWPVPRLIRVGGRRINPAYLIQAFEWDGSAEAREFAPGSVRVVMLAGDPFLVSPADAPAFLRAVDRFVLEDQPPPVARAVELDPATGEPL